MTDDPLTTCPRCGQHIRRVLFPAGIVFKGSGFYVTDSRKATQERAESKQSAETKASESKSAESKSDAKSETKSDGSKESAA